LSIQANFYRVMIYQQ